MLERFTFSKALAWKVVFECFQFELSLLARPYFFFGQTLLTAICLWTHFRSALFANCPTPLPPPPLSLVLCATTPSKLWLVCKSCSQSFNGFSYDLTPMVRTAGASLFFYVLLMSIEYFTAQLISPSFFAAGHRDYVLTGANGEIVFINICAQVQNVPSSCRRDPDAIRGNAYVELNPSEGQICRSLGSSVHWRPIDDKNPDLGVDLIYSGGDVCTDGKTASARIRVLCDRDHTMGVPEDYPVERDRSSPCSYIVTWPSLYGCPIRSSSYFMIYSLIFVAVALFLVRSGCCSGIFQTDSIHEDDSNDGFGTSQVSSARSFAHVRPRFSRPRLPVSALLCCFAFERHFMFWLPVWALVHALTLTFMIYKLKAFGLPSSMHI